MTPADLLRASRAQRDASRYTTFRDRMPAILRSQPAAFDVIVSQGDRRDVAQVADVHGAAVRLQRASRFRFLEQQRAGKLSQPTATA